MTPALPDLTADCAACAAFCCIALSFDKGADFVIDKPAGEPCPKLAGYGCTIHERLEHEGFAGCVRFECAGAGQRTVALFNGAGWRERPGLLPQMMRTFRDLRTLHELIALLDAAGALPLPPRAARQRLRILGRLCPPDLTPHRAAELANGPLPGQVRAFLRTLAPHVPRAQSAPADENPAS